MKLSKIIFIIIVITFSCGQKRNTDRTNSQVRSIKISSENNEISTNLDFAVFWNKFRQAIIDLNYSEIESLTNFPLRTRGEMDSDSLILYDKKDFIRLLNAYLNQPTFSKEKGQITQRKEIEMLTQPDSILGKVNYVRIGNMEFKYELKRWKLDLMYLNIRDEDFWKR